MRDMNEPQGTAAPDGHPPDAAAWRVDGTPDWSAAMVQAQGGNREAYWRLLEAITPYLRALAARSFHNPSDVEDTVQDILLTLHTVRHTYDPARPFGPWLATIARRRIVDSLRRQGRIGLHETALDVELETFFADEANLSEEAVNARVVHDAVARLPKGQREAVQMLKLEEMSLKQAAAASGMSVAALKVATYRALRALRKLLEQGESKQ